MKSQNEKILCLNSVFFPIGIISLEDAFKKIMSDRMYPVDIYYSQKDNGEYDMAQVESFNVVRDFDEWMELPIRPCDDYITTPKTIVRFPPIVVCAHYNKIRHPKVFFPSNRNIWQRDNFTCGYTGKKLSKDELTVDHIIPISRGGGNTWENLVTCDKALNTWKDNRTPEECGLKLKNKPTKPKNGLIFDDLKAEWEIFVGK